jgi:hypothetical protein
MTEITSTRAKRHPDPVIRALMRRCRISESVATVVAELPVSAGGAAMTPERIAGTVASHPTLRIESLPIC